MFASLKMGSSASSALTLLAGCLVLVSRLACCSPPVDFLVYTNSKPLYAGANSSLHQLDSLQSIYGLDGRSEDTKLAARVLAIVQNASHTHDNGQVDLQASRFAWHLMESQALRYMKNRVDTLRPIVELLLNESGASSDCKRSLGVLLTDLGQLKHWASVMWNSWGDFPPAGLFEGSFTDFGSYRGCMSVADSEPIGQAQFCTLDYQPVVPSRPRYHSIFKSVLAVDPTDGRLNGGDFGQPTGPRLAAHEFSSKRFRDSATGRQATGDSPDSSKYNTKRNISTNSTIANQATATNATNLTLKAGVSVAAVSAWLVSGQNLIVVCAPTPTTMPGAG